MAGPVSGDPNLATGPALAGGMAGLIREISNEPGRHLAIPGTLNFRDAGGYPVADGGVTGWRRLFRSDGLHRLGLGATNLLGRLGLRTVLDLRTSAETQLAPSPVDDLAGNGALTMNISLIGDDLSEIPDALEAIYDYIVDRRGAEIAAAIRSLARPGALPGLVHCTAGKDRTGIVIAFVLAAIGVPDEFVAADYALTARYLDPASTPAIGLVSGDTGLDEELTLELLASPPELILRALDRARRVTSGGHGGIDGYLAAHGVTAEDLSRLRAALVS
jgi:protein-tyrosine phosphatase